MKFSSSITLLSAAGAMAYGGSSGGNVAVIEVAAGGSGGSGGSAGCCGGEAAAASMSDTMMAAAAPMSDTMMAAATSMGATPVMAAVSTTAAAMMAADTMVAAAAAMTHTVTVGGASLAYNPPQVSAAVGDTVLFVFMMKNHTATQSTFDKPCNKMDGGMDSGFQPNMMNVAMGAPTFNFTVMATAPTWWYCKQKMPMPHCGAGMVFAVNPTAEKSFQTFQQQAIALNGTAAASAAAATSTAAASSVTLSVDNGAAASTAVAVAAPPAATTLAAGWNTQGNTGACSCACFCGVAAFPAGSLDGIGAFGGMAGALPAPW